MDCARCTARVPERAQFCPQCGSSTSDGAAEQATRTRLDPEATAPPGSRSHGTRHTPPSFSSGRSWGAGGLASAQELGSARFLPGMLVAERYRIVGLLGRGGMGEVYRADDLKLGMPVALKFLPEALQDRPDRVERFLDEVRTARQIAHANVCRVHDVGEVAGQHFLSMEYVDGEDLGSLLRRIGRLPSDKAVQIARQLCAGLAAAHERGILHRDLKPANVMIDGRGQVRITDFGLAGMAESFSGAEIRAGTPDYMAPEQLAGTEVTVQSDVYALGHVLYELFTGARAFRAQTLVELTRLQREVAPSRPSSLVEEIDPTVERVILWCLEKDPEERPPSALAVAAALPGGDPLAAALAAGETPSPEMVAAAGPRGGLRPGVAAALLGGIAASLVGLGFTVERMHLHGRVPLERGLAALEENARTILAELGYDEAPTDRVTLFDVDGAELIGMAQRDHGPGRWAALEDPRQRVLTLFTRRSADYLAPANIAGAVGANDPWPQPGDVQLGLDLGGRLISLRVTSGPDDSAAGSSPAPDWRSLFEVAGLEAAAFEPTEPRARPALYADERLAFAGVLPDGVRARIETAFAAGRPVYFEIVDEHDPAWSGDAAAGDRAGAVEGAKAISAFVMSIVLAIAGGAIWLAWRNSKLGRSDLRGGIVVAAAVVALRLGDWLLGGHHVPQFLQELFLFVAVLGGAMVLAGLTLVFYLAIEPYARRLRPEGLVSWTRLLKGRLRDPLVGRDALIGAAFGMGFHLLALVGFELAVGSGQPPWMPNAYSHAALAGGRHAVAQLLESSFRALAVALGLTLLFLLLKIVLRKTWVAAAAFALVFVVLGLVTTIYIEGPAMAPAALASDLAFNALQGAAIAVLVVRYGVLSTAVAFTVSNVLVFLPISLDPSRPYFATSLLALGTIAVLALVAYRVSLAGDVFRRAASGTP
jgi:serine/threonine-protein kinase